MNSKLSPFVLFFLSFIIFKFIWQYQVPVNDIYIYIYVFSIPFKNSYDCIGIFGDTCIVDDYN